MYFSISKYYKQGEEYLKKLFTFGEISCKKIVTLLFKVGIIPIIFKSYIFGTGIYLTNTISKQISYMKYGREEFISTQVNNLPLGIFTGITFFIVSVLLWKVVCEVLLLLFRGIEIYINNNQNRNI